MSNTTSTSFDDLYRESTSVLKQREFSTELLNFSNRQQRIDVDIDDALSAYKQVSEDSPVAAHMLSFVNKGIQSIKDSMARRHTVFSLTANSVHQLREMMIQLDIQVPSWMPETFRLPNNNPQFTHNYTYYFDWSTVGAHLVSQTDKKTIEVIIKRLSKNGPAHKKNLDTGTADRMGSLANHPVLSQAQQQLKSAASAPKVLPLDAPAPQPNNNQVSPATVSAPVTVASTGVSTLSVAPAVPATTAVDHQLSPRVKLSLLAARQYMDLYAKSQEEAVAFTLSIDELTELLRTKECYFTQEALVMEHSEHAQMINDNQIAIARLNHSKGFVTGNLVACSHKALLLKGELDASAFEQMMSALNTLKNSGLSPQQLQTMMTSMKMVSNG